MAIDINKQLMQIAMQKIAAGGRQPTRISLANTPVVPHQITTPGVVPTLPTPTAKPHDNRGTVAPSYQHPSGAIQFGKINYPTPTQQTDGGVTNSTPRPGAVDAVGLAYGPNVLHISQHGGGTGNDYTLSNPDMETGKWGTRTNISERANKPRNATRSAPILPENTNPECVISGACNAEGGGDPSLYARWLNAERGVNNDDTNSPSRLNRVVMTPPGLLGQGQHEGGLNSFIPSGNDANPYMVATLKPTADGKVMSPSHDYRLAPGGDPTQPGSWIDTGIYTDARRTPAIPIVGTVVGMPGEVQEIGRHIGLGDQLGGGDFNSYVNKVREINNNPDMSYLQKVQANFARPIGATAATAQIVGEQLAPFNDHGKIPVSGTMTYTPGGSVTPGDTKSLQTFQPPPATSFGSFSTTPTKPMSGPSLSVSGLSSAPKGSGKSLQLPKAPTPSSGFSSGADFGSSFSLGSSSGQSGMKKQNSFDIKSAELQPWVQLQPHQQRVADRISTDEPRMLVYHGLGTGKSLGAIAAAEAAKSQGGGEYGIVAPASLRDNFKKEVGKFTRGSTPEVMSYTEMALGRKFKTNPGTLIFDEMHRMKNPESLSSRASIEAAKQAPRVALLSGSPIINHPTDLATPLSILKGQNISPEEFEKLFVQYKKVKPGWWPWLRGVQPGEEMDVKNPEQFKSVFRGHVDYNPGKSPEGVDVNEEVIDAPMTTEQERIQKAIRTKVPPRFLWKIDQEFPLSREELGKLNSFLTGMRQVSLSTQPFRADGNPLKAFGQSGKLQLAVEKLKGVLDSDERKKAIIYSNYIDAGLQPYAAALKAKNIPHALFHGGVSPAERRKALDEYNAGKLRALLIGPAGAEGISTKGTSLIQLLDPHWNETRSQQAKGRGLRFDSHMGLPEELKDVAVQRFISRASEPGWLKRMLFKAKRQHTGDEILDRLSKDKEKGNDKFRKLLQEVGTEQPG